MDRFGEAVDRQPPFRPFTVIPAEVTVPVTRHITPVVGGLFDDNSNSPTEDVSNLEFLAQQKIFVNPFPSRYHRPPTFSPHVFRRIRKLFPKERYGNHRVIDTYLQCPPALENCIERRVPRLHSTLTSRLFIRNVSKQFLADVLPPDFYELTDLISKKTRSLDAFICARPENIFSSPFYHADVIREASENLAASNLFLHRTLSQQVTSNFCFDFMDLCSRIKKNI